MRNTFITYGPGGDWCGPWTPYNVGSPTRLVEMPKKEKKPNVAPKSIDAKLAETVETAVVKVQVARLLNTLSDVQRGEVIEWLVGEQSYGVWDES